MITVDAVVIGGGVAGCSAAIALAEAGAATTLIEAKAYPHHKVCGEVLSPGCMPLLQRLGTADAISELRPAPLDHVHITTPNGTRWQSALGGVGVSRCALDRVLAERAQTCGARLLDQTSVVAVDGSLDNGFTVTTRASSGAQQTLQTRLVIGAHGKRSTLDRVFDRAFLRQPQPFVGLKAHFIGDPIPNRVELHTFPGGYCGMSEIEGDRRNVCLLVRQDVFARVSGGDIPAFVRWMQTQNPALGAWLSTAALAFPSWLSISQIPFVRKTVIECDVLMTGDAAGLIAPLAGDGIEMALRGGIMAAAAGVRFLDRQWSAADLRARYAAAWRRAFALRLRLARLLQAIMLRPPLLDAGLRLLNTAPAFGALLVRQTRDPRAAPVL